MNIDNFRNVEQSKMINQPVAVRYFDSQNPEDMRRLLAMVSMPAAQKWLEEVDGMEMKHVVKWAKQRAKKVGRGYQYECLFAISGATNEKPQEEAGEVQAFVNSYEVEDELLERMTENNLIHSNNIPVIEISFAKNPSLAPNRVASGIIQVCFQLNQMLSGHGNPDQNKPLLQILAFVNPENINGAKCLEQACFNHIGDIKYDAESTGLDKVYRINWEEAQAYLHKKTDPYFTEKI